MRDPVTSHPTNCSRMSVGASVALKVAKQRLVSIQRSSKHRNSITNLRLIEFHNAFTRSRTSDFILAAMCRNSSTSKISPRSALKIAPSLKTIGCDCFPQLSNATSNQHTSTSVYSTIDPNNIHGLPSKACGSARFPSHSDQPVYLKP